MQLLFVYSVFKKVMILFELNYNLETVLKIQLLNSIIKNYEKVIIYYDCDICLCKYIFTKHYTS